MQYNLYKTFGKRTLLRIDQLEISANSFVTGLNICGNDHGF